MSCMVGAACATMKSLMSVPLMVGRPSLANIPVPFLCVGRDDEPSCKGKCEKSAHRITSGKKRAGPGVDRRSLFRWRRAALGERAED